MRACVQFYLPNIRLRLAYLCADNISTSAHARNTLKGDVLFMVMDGFVAPTTTPTPTTLTPPTTTPTTRVRRNGDDGKQPLRPAATRLYASLHAPSSLRPRRSLLLSHSSVTWRSVCMRVYLSTDGYMYDGKFGARKVSTRCIRCTYMYVLFDFECPRAPQLARVDKRAYKQTRKRHIYNCVTQF